MCVFKSHFFFLLFPGESILKQVLFLPVILHFMDCYCFGGIIQKLWRNYSEAFCYTNNL